MWANALGNTENGDTGCLQSISNSQHGRRLAGPHDPFDDHDSGPDVTKEPAHAEPDDGLSHALLLAKLLPLLPIASFHGGATMQSLLEVGSIGQCNTARSLSAGVSKPKVFRGR